MRLENRGRLTQLREVIGVASVHYWFCQDRKTDFGRKFAEFIRLISIPTDVLGSKIQIAYGLETPKWSSGQE